MLSVPFSPEFSILSHSVAQNTQVSWVMSQGCSWGAAGRGAQCPLPPCLLGSGWGKHLCGFGSWVVSKPNSGQPDQQVFRYTMALLMPWRTDG